MVGHWGHAQSRRVFFTFTVFFNALLKPVTSQNVCLKPSGLASLWVCFNPWWAVRADEVPSSEHGSDDGLDGV